MSATDVELRRYGTGHYVPTIVGDPGPVPAEPRARFSSRYAGSHKQHVGPEKRRLSRIALDLDEAVDRAWFDLVSEVRATHDLQALLALQRFALILRDFHGRPR